MDIETIKIIQKTNILKSLTELNKNEKLDHNLNADGDVLHLFLAIRKILAQVEETYSSKIVYASICGSQAYGFSLYTSDIDLYVIIDLDAQIQDSFKENNIDVFVRSKTFLINHPFNKKSDYYGSVFFDSFLNSNSTLINIDNSLIDSIKEIKFIEFLDVFLEYFSIENIIKKNTGKELYHIYRILGVVSYLLTNDREIQIRLYYKALHFKLNYERSKLNSIIFSEIAKAIKQLKKILSSNRIELETTLDENMFWFDWYNSFR